MQSCRPLMSVKCSCDSLGGMPGDLPPGHARWISVVVVAVVIIVFLSLAHSLVEIRVRSLRNIVSKLQLGLVTPADLVQERQLFINLLHWFNFPEVPLQEEVLQLINTLATVPYSKSVFFFYYFLFAFWFLYHFVYYHQGWLPFQGKWAEVFLSKACIWFRLANQKDDVTQPCFNCFSF